MNMKAALYEPAAMTAKRGRRRKKGQRLLSPLEMSQDSKANDWIKTTVTLYGKPVKLWYQTVDALWYPSAGQQLLRIVLVRDPSGRRCDDCLFSLDLTSPRRKSWSCFPDAGRSRSAFATSNSFSALKIRRTGWPKQPRAPLL